MRDFFPLPRVVTGLFRLVQNLFGVIIEEVKEGEAATKGKGVKSVAADMPPHFWHQTVKLFRVSDGESGKELGHFYFDPYIRYLFEIENVCKQLCRA